MHHLQLDLVLISSLGPRILTKLLGWVLASQDPH